ncbi:MAG: ADP-forming succinate--CoA ligase subunit beta [Planctomycetota bacterium]|nr:MAG: ADP-forming succinate--CoA ligase subunit beta [Planctomycetota bacterium]
MNIHEYQAKEFFKRYRIPIPNGIVAGTPEEAADAAFKLETQRVVVKAQVKAGGRGKGGGVKVVPPKEASAAAAAMFESGIKTHQTGGKALPVRQVLVEEGVEFESGADEYYLAIILDRSAEKPVVMASAEGGMDIEAVPEEKILKMHFDVSTGVWAFEARNLGLELGLAPRAAGAFARVVVALGKLFVEEDASLAEINPLIVKPEGTALAIDAKLNFDDSAMFRHKKTALLEDLGDMLDSEKKARELDLAYIPLDEGNIGCIVNGAGLAMATMDVIQAVGGAPANFLDVGGGASKEKVTEAIKIVLSDSKVKTIFINIFGGIMRCDVIAEGMVAAAQELGLKLPLVVRLAGNKAAEGKEILNKSGLSLITANDMRDGAEKAVKAAAEA